MLAIIESGKTFFVSGSAYLQKDMFMLQQGKFSVPPGQLNVIASFTPFIGLMIGGRIVAMGTRRVTAAFALLAGLCLFLLAHEKLREIPWLVVLLMLCVKTTFGPLTTCISLIKVEAFPTEVRVTAFAIISLVAKVMCAFAPTLIEQLKGGHEASSWDPVLLSTYLALLCFGILTAGFLALFVPGVAGDGAQLEDFVDKQDECSSIKGPRTSILYGALQEHDIWEDHSESGSLDSSTKTLDMSVRNTPRFTPQPSANI